MEASSSRITKYSDVRYFFMKDKFIKAEAKSQNACCFFKHPQMALYCTNERQASKSAGRAGANMHRSVLDKKKYAAAETEGNNYEILLCSSA